jgi:sulfonate dioxygenase
MVHHSNGDLWHTDVSYERQPPGTTTLKIDTLPPVGGDTLWASAYVAYEKLSPAIQKLLEGLEAVHSAKEQAENSAKNGGPVRREPVENIHPIVRTHPVTKRKALYVNPVFTRRIVGLTHRESRTYSLKCIVGNSNYSIDI